MSNVYDKHRSAFSHVSAYALVSATGDQIGTLAFKYPRDGAGRVSCFLHVHGSEMVVGYASGYGYDKTGAAFESACANLPGSGVIESALRDNCSDIGGQDIDRAIQSISLRLYSAV